MNNIKAVHTIEPLTDEQRSMIAAHLSCDVVQLDRCSFVRNGKVDVSVEALICRDRDDIETILELSPNLQFMYIVSAGVEKLPFKHLIERQVVVCNASGVNAQAMSQYAMAQILAHATKTRENLLSQLKHHWIRFQGTDDLQEKVLFVAGAGRSGAALAAKAKTFGMRVIGTNYPVRPVDGFDEVIQLEDFSSRIGEADYVVCALPLTKLTSRYFNRSIFRAMKNTCVFINMSRGGLVSGVDLIDALRNHELSSAVLDVFDIEPLSVDDPIWDVPGLYVTPHMAGRIDNFMDMALRVFCENIAAYDKGEQLPNKVNLSNGF